MNRIFPSISLGLLLSLICSPVTSAQSDNPACLQILEAQTNLDIAKANSDAALKVARTTGQSASFYKSAKAYYNQVKKEENTASIILKSVTKKGGKKPRKQK